MSVSDLLENEMLSNRLFDKIEAQYSHNSLDMRNAALVGFSKAFITHLCMIPEVRQAIIDRIEFDIRNV